MKKTKFDLKAHKLTLGMVVLSLTVATAGCAGKKITLKDSGSVDANLVTALQGTKDVLNTYGFDLRTIDEGEEMTKVISKHPNGQSAWVAIEKDSENRSDILVEVNNKGGRVKTSAVDILKDIEVKY